MDFHAQETHKTSVKGRCNDEARCYAGTQCFFCSISWWSQVAIIHRHF
jgi:hypothetical protein